jgi:hypothetical protein
LAAQPSSARGELLLEVRVVRVGLHDPLPAHRDHLLVGQFAGRLFVPLVVAGYRHHRRQPTQLVQRREQSHVARVQDQVDAPEDVEQRRRERQAAVVHVRVRDQAQRRHYPCGRRVRRPQPLQDRAAHAE